VRWSRQEAELIGAYPKRGLDLRFQLADGEALYEPVTPTLVSDGPIYELCGKCTITFSETRTRKHLGQDQVGVCAVTFHPYQCFNGNLSSVW